MLVCEAAVGLDDRAVRDAREAFEGVDVLGEAHPHQLAVVQHLDKGVRGRWAVLSREELPRQCVNCVFDLSLWSLGIQSVRWHSHGTGFSRKKFISKTASG